MKNRFLKVLAFALLLALATGALPAMAAAPKILAMDLYTGTGEWWLDFDDNWTWTEDIYLVKSSNPDVIQVPEKDLEKIVPQKAGKSKITVKYKTDDGKKHAISRTMTVTKYPKAVKSLTINNKKIPMKDNNKVIFRYEGDMDKKLKLTINLKPNTGWSISKIKAYSYEMEGYGDDVNRKTLKVKNNKRFTVADDREAVVTYTLKNKKGKTFNYTIYVYHVGE